MVTLDIPESLVYDLYLAIDTYLEVLIGLRDKEPAQVIPGLDETIQKFGEWLDLLEPFA